MLSYEKNGEGNSKWYHLVAAILVMVVTGEVGNSGGTGGTDAIPLGRLVLVLFVVVGDFSRR